MTRVGAGAGHVGVVVAGSGAEWESRLVGALDGGLPGIRLVRRCLDLADLLATTSTGTARVAVVDADLRRLDRESVVAVHGSGVVVVAVAADETADRRVRELDVDAVIGYDVEVHDLTRLVHSVAAATPGRHSPRPSTTPDTSPLADADVEGLALEPVGRDTDGAVIAVWGPVGAPGRTSVALNLAAELALLDSPVLLAEADTYGPSLSQLLGVLDEAPGLAAATRAANAGTLDVLRLQTQAVEVLPGLRLLAAPTRTQRWVELRRSALDEVWRVGRRLAAWTVIDVGFCVEQDESLIYDTDAPQRNAGSLSALAAADVVMVVLAADPIGVARMVRALPEVREAAPNAAIRVVANRVRSSVIGSDAERQLRAALLRHSGVEIADVVPDDPKSFDASLRAGRALCEAAPRSAARQRFASIAADLGGRAAPRGRRRRAA